MFSSENIGIISKTPLERNCFGWELPNCFAYQFKIEREDMIPHIVSSPWFSAFDNEWRLALVRNGERHLTDSVGLFLWLKSSFMIEAPNIYVKFTLLDHSGKDYNTYHGNVDFNGSFGTWDFLDLKVFAEKRNIISASGVLRFYCSMEDRKAKEVVRPLSSTAMISKDDESESDDDFESDEKSEEDDKTERPGIIRLVQHLKSLLKDEESCDVLLKAEDREFKAHRCILMAWSPVFASMFKHDFKENASGVIDIPECSAAAFEVVLLYLYTGSANAISSNNIFDLYNVADKYNISDLKSECVEFMEKNLSVDKICEIMALSLQHHEERLLKKATRFFCDNVKNIIMTVQWQKFVINYPNEATRLLSETAKH